MGQRKNEWTTGCELIGFVALVIIIHIAVLLYCARMWLKERVRDRLFFRDRHDLQRERQPG